jgi:hypothetical protein
VILDGTLGKGLVYELIAEVDFGAMNLTGLATQSGTTQRSRVEVAWAQAVFGTEPSCKEQRLKWASQRFRHSNAHEARNLP